MRLSTQADYAVRVVYELASRPSGAIVQTKEIAAAQDAPEGYLAKVVQALARAGVLRTVRGSQGGIVLARPAAEISVREVCEAIEGPTMFHRCAQRVEPCCGGPVRDARLLDEDRVAARRTNSRARPLRPWSPRRPTATASPSPTQREGGERRVTALMEQVEKALGDVRPALQADGGDIELVGVTDDGIVQVRLQGACAGCPMSQMTLTQGVERHLKTVVPGVERVENLGF